MAVCAGCGQAVIWCKNDKTGKSAPVNPDPDENGNVWIVGNGEYHVMTKAERSALTEPGFFDGPPKPRFTLHFTNCTHPEVFRKRDAKAHRVTK